MMVVNLPLLLISIALLWFPRRWFRLGASLFRRRRRKTGNVVEPWRTREAGDPRVSFVTEFTKFRNYLDLLRAAAGSVALAGGFGVSAALAAVPDAPRAVTLQIGAIRASILLIGLLIQTVRYEKRHISLYPAIFYLAGLTVGLCDIRAAICAFALIWALNLGLPTAATFLSVYSLLLLVIPVLFARRVGIWPGFAAGLAFLPVLLSLLARRALTILSRKPARTP